MAASLLDSAGYKLADDGNRYKDGKKMESLRLLVYDDPPPYDGDDLEGLRELIQGPDCFLIPTVKDGMRLLSHADQLTPEERSRILYLPIEVSLSPKQERRFRERLQRAIKNNGLHL